MAWCTFSSDDYQCDLRLVSTFDGYIIQVAAERVCGQVPSTSGLHAQGYERELAAAERSQIAYVRDAPREPIDLPMAGLEFRIALYQDFVEKVQELVDLGYRIPDEVAEELGVVRTLPTP